MKLFNTLTHRLEDFETRHPGEAAIYNCGPTVYDYTHIGHVRPALLGDVLVRWLRHRNYVVTYVVNFTDVDDRIIERAGKEGISFREYAQRYMDDYRANMAALGIDQVDRYVNATDHIDEMLEIIGGLVAKGHAYPLDGDVYFDVTSDPDYGRLSGRSLDEMRSGARVAVNERKHHPGDFALWKGAKPGEPFWPSPWGPGRPGWHIECSAMTRKYLGHGFDVHLGGEDLIFPHHENEIAQSECFAGEAPLARFWLHNAMLDIAETKMSKSLGNSIALREVLQRVPPAVLRLFLLTSHYRKTMEYSQDALVDARKGWERLTNVRAALAAAVGADAEFAGHRADGSTGDLSAESERARRRFADAMDDDLNTPGALAAIYELARASNTALNAPGGGGVPSGARDALAALQDLTELLGIRLESDADASRSSGERTEKLVTILLQLRDEARAARDWPLADRLRDDLEAAGVLVEDTPRGPRWKWRD